jgi:hypothetical protein
MVLTAESGWSFGEHGYGEDKKKALQEALNEFLAEEGKEQVNWDEEDVAKSKAVRPEPVRTKSASAEGRGDAAPSQAKARPRLRRV